jgi:transglutaminase-like putative cysteine protease
LLNWQIKREAEYGNRFLEAHVQNVKPGARLGLSYTITRRELSNPLQRSIHANAVAQVSPRLLEPDRLVPLDGQVKNLAQETLAGVGTGADATLAALYEKTVSMMAYDKSGTGWGQGDVIWACDNKRGNCTDFHSVLIGMARASNIPAKFEIGLSIPTDKENGPLTGYHCWAYLLHPQRGWVPMDASEGWKNNKKYKDYYLGRMGSDRVALSVGRDIKLGQRGKSLNYFVFPYAEAGEKAVPMKVEVSFAKSPVTP